MKTPPLADACLVMGKRQTTFSQACATNQPRSGARANWRQVVEKIKVGKGIDVESGIIMLRQMKTARELHGLFWGKRRGVHAVAQDIFRSVSRNSGEMARSVPVFRNKLCRKTQVV